MSRTLITFAIALALVLVAGCGERISPEKYAELNARADTIVAQHDTIEATLRGILSYIPCKPCPPETVFALPPGRWISKDTLCLWITGSDCEDMEVRIYGQKVDSVFILSKREE